MAIERESTMRVNVLLIVTALFEGATGVLLLLAPAVVLAALFGWREVGPEMALMSRVAGAALLGLGAASWLARDDGDSLARRGLLTGLVIYNVAAAVLLAFAGVVLKMAGVVLWPAVVVHVALTVWCGDGLRRAGPKRR